jgi:hypothetical protein
MTETFLADFVTDEERKSCQINEKPFVSYLNRYILKVEIIEKGDFFQSAYFLFKHPSLYDLSESDWLLLNETDLRSISPFIEHEEKKKPFYVTSDGVTFYQVIEWKIEENGILRFSLAKIMDEITFSLN